MIALDPARFRPMIVPSVLEKLSYASAVAVLYLPGRLSVVQAVTTVPDSILCLLFVIAFFMVRPAMARPQPTAGTILQDGDS